MVSHPWLLQEFRHDTPNTNYSVIAICQWTDWTQQIWKKSKGSQKEQSATHPPILKGQTFWNKTVTTTKSRDCWKKEVMGMSHYTSHNGNFCPRKNKF